jgi:cyclin D3
MFCFCFSYVWFSCSVFFFFCYFFKVQDTKYVFEAKTIQRMELLILSTLKWKMHPITPHSFLDHIIRRLGLKTNLHWEFLRRCENLLLAVLLGNKHFFQPSQ